MFKVSHYAQRIMATELDNIVKYGHKYVEKCCCALQTTHGLPCACQLKAAKDSQSAITVDQIHPFWKSLDFEDSRTHACPSDYGGHPSDAHRYYSRMTEEVLGRNEATVYKMACMIDEELNPEYGNVGEPETVERMRGRPRGSRGISRDKSTWEKNRSRSKSTTGRKKSSNSGSIPSVNNGMCTLLNFSVPFMIITFTLITFYAFNRALRGASPRLLLRRPYSTSRSIIH